MNENVERVLDELEGFRMAGEMTYTAYSRLHDSISELNDLLKEHEVVEPIAKEDDTYECICGAIVGWDELDASGIVQTRLNYCPRCGRAVKWE